MLVKIVIACFAIFSVCHACDDDRFKPLLTAKTSAKSANDDFTLSIFGNPDKYIPHLMYIGKQYRACSYSTIHARHCGVLLHHAVSGEILVGFTFLTHFVRVVTFHSMNIAFNVRAMSSAHFVNFS